MHRTLLKFVLPAILLALSMVVSHPVQAAFPEKPITIVIPWPAGTGPDVAMRIVAELMRDDVGQPVVVTNVVGGSGTKAFAHVKNKPADGYTILNTWVAPHTVAPLFNPNAGYVANKDFEPVGGFVYLPFTLMVNKNHPANNLKEFVSWAKSQNRKLKFAACAALSVPRMVMEEFTLQAGINATPVPFPGCNADNSKSVVDGSTDYATSTLNWIPVFGKVTKTLAIFTEERHPYAPDLPTAKEQGYDTGWGKVGMGWGGLSVKAGTPKDRLGKLQALFKKWLQNKTFVERSAKNKFPITYTAPDEFYALWVKSEKVLTPAVNRILKAQGKK